MSQIPITFHPTNDGYIGVSVHVGDGDDLQLYAKRYPVEMIAELAARAREAVDCASTQVDEDVCHEPR